MENKGVKINDRWKSDQNGNKGRNRGCLVVREGEQGGESNNVQVAYIDRSEDTQKVTKINQKRVFCNKPKK